MARKAEYNFVWVPIDRSLEFDEDKANFFIDEFLGIDYGYEVILFGQLDTIKDNLPCRKYEVFYFSFFNNFQGIP